MSRTLTARKSEPLPSLSGCSADEVAALMPPSSQSLAAYLRRVYGSAPQARLKSWDWREIDVLWWDHFFAVRNEYGGKRAVSEACTEGFGSKNHRILTRSKDRFSDTMFYALPMRAGFSRAFSNTRLLWRLRARARCIEGEKKHHGGSKEAASTLEDMLGQTKWVEVQHVMVLRKGRFDLGKPSLYETRFFWLNVARGSGLWYRMGRTRVYDDLHSHHASHHAGPGEANIPHQIRWLFNLSSMQGIETVHFRKRLGDDAAFTSNASNPSNASGNSAAAHDWACSRQAQVPFYSNELVSVRRGIGDCPDAHTHVSSACEAMHDDEDTPSRRVSALCRLPSIDDLRWGWPEASERNSWTCQDCIGHHYQQLRCNRTGERPWLYSGLTGIWSWRR